MQTIQKSRVPDLLAALAKDATVFVPAKDNGVSSFVPWVPGVELALGEGNTTLSPKGVTFPQTEKMYCYKAPGTELSIEEVPADSTRRVVFGIRPCDVKGFYLMDQLFLTRGYEDTFYKTKRDNSVLISLGCIQAMPTCFCEAFGINPGKAEGADVLMYDLGDFYGFEAVTAKGEGVLALAGGLFSTAGGNPPAAAANSLQVDVEGITPKLQKMFEHPLWAEICRTCLNCGTCTYVCPTCHCFDINSANRGQEGYKYRCWDSCMFSDYTLMAGGHQPRPTKKERVRNRFLHKLQYYPERFGDFGCVGCGRCLAKCPVTIDITRLIRQFKEVALDVQ